MNQPSRNQSSHEPRTSRRRNQILQLCAVLVPVLVVFGVTFAFIPKLTDIASAEPSDAGEKQLAQAAPEESSDKKSSEKDGEAKEKKEEITEAKDKAAEKKIKERAAEKEAKDKAAAEKRAAEKRAAEKAAAEKEAEEAATPPPPSDPTMSLTVPRLGLYGDTVRNSAKPNDLHRGAIKVPVTGFPWEGGANTYIAGHRVGFAGTESYYQFYDLPAMQKDDAVYLTDANGTTYEYRVTEIFAVSPSENWVTAPIPGRDIVTLQTCTESLTDWWTLGPNLYNSTPGSGRLVVQADKVAVDYPEGG